MPDKDVLYHELLDDLAAGGCALCRAAAQASDSYIDALLYEGVVDVRLREELRDARGLCDRHAWRMAHQRGSVLGTAIIYRDVINTLAKILEAADAASPRPWGSRKQALARKLAPSVECPACRLENDAIQRAAKTLLRHLDDAEIAGHYDAAGGLCMAHFGVVLDHAGESAAVRLAGWQANAFRRLRGELDELIRKHDYRFRGEPFADREADSWTRAVAAVVGAEPKVTPGD